MFQVTRKPISDLDGKGEATRSIPVYTLTGELKWYDVSEKEYADHVKYMSRFPEGGGAKVPGAPTLIAKAIETETTTETAQAAPVLPLAVVPDRPRRAGSSRPSNRSQGNGAARPPKTETEQIRAWAREILGRDVADRGALPKGLRDEWIAAGSPGAAAPAAVAEPAQA